MTMKLPSLLSFERKLETSDALMYSGNWSDIGIETIENEQEIEGKIRKIERPAWKEIPITKRNNRSTQSAYGIDDAKKSEPNPVSSDSDDANLPHNKDTLKVSYTLRVIGNVGKPFACNVPDFETLITEKVKTFKESETGLKQLASRYAYNIANGRFLWRNRVCAENIKIHVFHGETNPPLEFTAYDFALNNFDENSDNNNLKKLTEVILTGLNSHEDFIFLKIDAYVKLGNGQHVFPSQEMNMNEKGKILFKLNECAAIHNVKIGNALRTVDNWYDAAEFPIAAEPYGSVTQSGQAYRKSKNDLYTLMEAWVNETENKLNDNDKSYIISNLIRGGVFSGESKKKAKK
ncbi:type I-F CRISPR-associated protein Csy3 [Methyloprofundus sedimenti]|uniref:Type I-F CRISPR-associated protein Csy3 n=1 Tax=Methyloprofundus sedimenti TaxID=1420851 RepID=A0A1V8M607_9GAMM|nr:type I-F CRISPR-associated protein Csy3 [Methyloprofundus sedimenti]OQK16926.1 type I-F CRISPR-associated protein Csy3 [Methyloprofundus sedimenti]